MSNSISPADHCIISISRWFTCCLRRLLLLQLLNVLTVSRFIFGRSLLCPLGDQTGWVAMDGDGHGYAKITQ